MGQAYHLTVCGRFMLRRPRPHLSNLAAKPVMNTGLP